MNTLKQHIKLKNLIGYVSAILFALAIPSILFGRASIGLTLGFSLVLILCVTPPTQVWEYAKTHLNRQYFIAGVLCWFATSFSILTSLEFNESLSTWLRQPVIPLLIFILTVCLHKWTDFIIKLVVIAFFILGLFLLFSLYVDPRLYYLSIRVDRLDAVAPTLKKIVSAIIFIAPLGSAYFLLKKKVTLSILIYVFAGIVCLSIFAKASVAGYFASFVVISIYFLSKNAKKEFLLGFATITSASLAGLFYWLHLKMYGLSREAAEIGYLPTWLIDFHRQIIWKFSWEQFLISPWLGYGINASNYIPESSMSIQSYLEKTGIYSLSEENATVLPGHPHNWLVEMFLDTGITGGLPFTLLVIAIFVILFKKYRATKSLGILAAAGISAAYWGSGLFNFSYWSAWWQASYYVSFAMCIMLYWQERAQKIKVRRD